MFTDWVQNVQNAQNVPSHGIFWNSSHWYRVTVLQIFYLFIEVSLTQNNHHSAHILLFTYGMFFQIQLDHFIPMVGALVVQQLRTEKLEMLPVLRKGVQGPLYQDNSNKM